MNSRWGVDRCVGQNFSALQSVKLLAKSTILAVATALAVAPATVFAVPINYGSFMGTTVLYEMVQEDANSVGDVPPLFGPPTTIGAVPVGFPGVPCVMCNIPGNTLDFNPVGFSASATNGGVDLTDGNLSFMVRSKNGQGIFNVEVKEAGDVSLTGFGGDATFAAVTTNVFIDIVEVNGVGVDPISFQEDLVFAPSGGTYGLGSDGGGGPLYNSGWTGTLLVDIQQELIDRNIAGIATKVNVNIDNTLSALSQEGTFALIAKKDHGVIITTNIPEPGSVVLALFGVMVCGLGLRRTRG
jgi:hypothetical protein